MDVSLNSISIIDMGVKRQRDFNLEKVFSCGETVANFQEAAALTKQRERAWQLIDSWVSQHQRVFEGLSKLLDQVPEIEKRFQADLLDAGLPSNLVHACLPSNIHLLLELIKNRTIGVFGVPGASIMRELLSRSVWSDQRAVLESRAEEIVSDCKKALIKEEILSNFSEVEFVNHAITALEEGHVEAAQALLTNVLDSLFSRIIPDPNKKRKIKSKKDKSSPFETGNLELIQALVWYPVRNAYREFWVHKQDPIPEEYNRHATAHAVSWRQYTEVNCLSALLLTTSLLIFTVTIPKERWLVLPETSQRA